MKSYRQIVREASQIFRGHKLGEHPKAINLWNSVEWQEMSQPSGNLTAQLTTAETPHIQLFPPLLQQANGTAAILREFGLLLQRKGGDRARTIWERKLDLPTPEQIAMAKGKLQDPEIRTTCKSYEQVKNTYAPKGTAVDRLVFINVYNALLANNIPFRDSHGVDITTWGPTTEYANQKKYHSLVPLTSAYCPPDVHRCFGTAFAEYLSGDLRCCRDSSVAAAMKRIIENVVSRLDPFPAVS